MRLNRGILALMLCAGPLAPAAAVTGCAGDELAYDPYVHQYHRWNRGEDLVYRRWESGTNRRHMDFARRTPPEQQAYWGWRHNSSPADHGGYSRRGHP
jgi:hypothetical protein